MRSDKRSAVAFQALIKGCIDWNLWILVCWLRANGNVQIVRNIMVDAIIVVPHGIDIGSCTIFNTSVINATGVNEVKFLVLILSIYIYSLSKICRGIPNGA